MRAVISRVKSVSVIADGEARGRGEKGLLVFLGVAPEDSAEDALLLSAKISKMRIFSDNNGKMNLSISDIGGTLAVISNFTLYANCSHGNRPDFFGAAQPEQAKALYQLFLDDITPKVPHCISGIFGADMQIQSECDGPVTIVLESSQFKKEPKT